MHDLPSFIIPTRFLYFSIFYFILFSIFPVVQFHVSFPVCPRILSSPMFPLIKNVHVLQTSTCFVYALIKWDQPLSCV